ncbi:TonB-dependent receptor [uncultured Amphritea sp.]|uniref:TonB-dependent receptor family protein n=1 Tax=uncultured Amphritea sp. TaxID=981605 RepID=UPI0025F631CC|nr:TonB-dependent receptor [uncultured Amphritea sp.]
MNNTRLCQAVLLSTSLASAIVIAQENTLNTIVVSATRFEESSNTTPTIVNTITADQIKASGANTIADVLKTQPGIHVRDAAGNGNRVAISMRGFGQNTTSNVLILVNGRRLNNQTLEAPNLNLIALQDIYRIEILQGSAGTLYGDQAVGGVVNIITQPIKEAQGHFSISRGSDDKKKVGLSYSEGFDNGLGFRLSAQSEHAGNYRDHSTTNFNNIYTELEKVYDTGRVFLELQKTDDHVELPNYLSLTQKNTDRRQSTSSDYVNYDSEVALIGLEQDLSDDWKLLGEYSVRDTDGEGILYSDYTQDTRVKSFTPRLVGKISDADVTFGYDRHNTNYERGGFAPQTRKQFVNAFYARTQIPLITEQLQLTLGGRNTRTEDKDIKNSLNHKQSDFVKEIGLGYQLTDEHRVFLRRDESIRYANMDELAQLPTGKTFLKPQEGRSVELGWEWSTPSNQIQATAFQLDLDNEIKFFPATYVNDNLDKSRRQGVVLSATHQYSEQLTLLSNYSYTEAKIMAGTHEGNYVPYVPNHTATLAIDYQLNSATNLYLDAKYTGSQYQDDDEENSMERVDSYTLVNANIRWKYQKFTTSVRVDNLLNKDYDAYTVAASWVPGGSAYYPAAGRQFMLTLNYDF